MSELIERMARRLAGHYGQPFDLLVKNKDEVRRWMRDGLPPHVASAMGGTRWDHNDPTQENHLDAARDALFAAREPTDAGAALTRWLNPVLKVALFVSVYLLGCENGWHDGRTRGWREGAEAALCALEGPQPHQRKSVIERCFQP